MHDGAQSAKATRILLVEDDDAVRDGVAMALTAQGFDVSAMDHAPDVAHVVQHLRPDLAILDIGLPSGLDGFEFAALLRTHSDMPIVFLTAADAVDDRLRGFDIGCDDYLTKPFSVRELISRLHAILRRYGRDGSSLGLGDLMIEIGTRSATRAGATLQLTPTEFDLLVELTRHAGTVIDKRSLLRSVWGFDDNATHLVEVYISSLRKKLEQHGPRIIKTTRGGYVLTRQ